MPLMHCLCTFYKYLPLLAHLSGSSCFHSRSFVDAHISTRDYQTSIFSEFLYRKYIPMCLFAHTYLYFFFTYFADRASQYINLNINQLDALNFIMGLFHASTCFEHMCSKHVEA